MTSLGADRRQFERLALLCENTRPVVTDRTRRLPSGTRRGLLDQAPRAIERWHKLQLEKALERFAIHSTNYLGADGGQTATVRRVSSEGGVVAASTNRVLQ